jgi:GTP-binding protein Era
MSTRSGFVTILGRPNAGKSTLLNQLAGSKLAIVSAKPQTTRAAITGVVTIDAGYPFAQELLRRSPELRERPSSEPLAQIIFLDTPGIQDPRTRLDTQMMEEVRGGLADRDLLLFLADASEHVGARDEAALDWVRRAGAPSFLVLNKIDRIPKLQVLPIMDRYRKLHEFREIVPVSALTGENLPVLVERIVAALPEGPLYFPPDQITEQPMRFLAGEIVREKVIQQTRKELPYACAVVVREFEERAALVHITADIIVEREGQKAIIIGAGGEMLKRIGTRARQELEAILNQKVFLELHVRVREGWREDPRFLDDLHWRKMVGQ